MSVNTVSTFLAVGSIVLLACVIAVWVTRLLAFASRRVDGVYRSILTSLDGQGTLVAWVMAVIAMSGSLYYSEIANFPPCEYCWYQRIAMYPLVLILGIAVIRKDRSVRRYAIPLASIGGLISAYHYLIQRMPDLSLGECSFGLPCTAAWVWKFDLVSIPFMAFVSFSVIVTALALDRQGPTALVATGPVAHTATAAEIEESEDGETAD